MGKMAECCWKTVVGEEKRKRFLSALKKYMCIKKNTCES